MKWRDSIDPARYRPRLLWLMLAGVIARFTVESSAVVALLGLAASLVVLIFCWMVHVLMRRKQHAAKPARLGGAVVALLGITSGALRLNAQDWLPAVFIALLGVQAGAFVAAATRWHIWMILMAAFTVVICSATQTHSPLFLLCAACFVCIALDLLILEHRDLREHAVTWPAANLTEQRSGGLVFAGVTLLLSIPLYLFLPKPRGWPPDQPYASSIVTPGAAAPLPASSPLPQLAPPPQRSVLPDVVPPENVTPMEVPPRVAQPERDDYGEAFGIGGVKRSLLLADAIMLHARSSHRVNLRGRIYDRFRAARWSRSAVDWQRIDLVNGTLSLAKPVGETSIQQDIEVALTLDPTLVHAPGAERIRFPASSLLRYADGVLTAAQPLTAGTAYSVEAQLDLRAGRYLLREPPPADLAPYLQVDGASARVRELARRIAASSPDALAKALTLEQHLRTHYTYSYETVAQQNYTPLDWFLFESKRGHCEFFASALAMLLRSVGIPARLATGFALTTPNPITGFYEVRALDGHAWVEAYIEGTGWLMLEPTPFYPLPTDSSKRSVAEELDDYLERRALTRELLLPATLQTRLTVLARDLWRSTRAGQKALADTARTLGWGLPLLLIASVAVLLACYLAWMAATDWLDNRRIRRSLAILPSDDVRRATLLVASVLLQTMRPRSLARREDWTLQEYAQQLAWAAANRNFPALVIPNEFIEAFDAARYGSAAVPHATQAQLQMTTLIHEQLEHNSWPRLRGAIARLQRVWRRVSNRITQRESAR